MYFRYKYQVCDSNDLWTFVCPIGYKLKIMFYASLVILLTTEDQLLDHGKVNFQCNKFSPLLNNGW